MTAPQPQNTNRTAKHADPALALAMRQHYSGDLDKAVAGYRQAYAAQPHRVDILFLLALALSQGPDIVEGEALLRQYLLLMSGDALAYHALAKVLQNRGDHLGAIPLFERAIAISPGNSPSWNDLATSLHRLERFEEAVTAFSRAIACDANWALPHFNLGTVYYDTNNHEAAETEYRTTLRLDPDLADAYSMLASTLDQLHRPDEAVALSDEYARRAPVTSRPCTQPPARARVLILMAAGLCNVRTDYLFDTSRYETITVFVRPDDTDRQEQVIAQLPDVDVVFSAVADPDRATPFLAPVAAFCARMGRPVINLPDHRISRTQRDTLPDLLRGIPMARIPQPRRMSAADVRALAAQGGRFAPELLVRPCGFHGGKFFARCSDAGQLSAYLDHTPQQEYYVTPYCDYRSADGHFRKYRFIFVDRQVYPYHLAISTDWMVHYFRTEMQRHPWMRSEEEAFLTDYRTLFPGALGDAVEAVARAVDLDYAGLDCGITPDGQLLVFESNAAMLVHLQDSPEIYPYKHCYVPRIAAAIDAMVAQRVADARARVVAAP